MLCVSRLVEGLNRNRYHQGVYFSVERDYDVEKDIADLNYCAVLAERTLICVPHSEGDNSFRIELWGEISLINIRLGKPLFLRLQVPSR
jgi:hypothetical protein